MELNTLKEKIVNVETGEVSYRNLSDAEIAEIEAARASVAEQIAQENANNAARRAVLEKLGLNEEDIKILLG